MIGEVVLLLNTGRLKRRWAMESEFLGFCRFVVVCISVGFVTGFGIYYFILLKSRKKLKKAELLLEKNGNGIIELQTKLAAGPRDSTILPAVDAE